MKVSELSGAQLDYWVAKAERYEPRIEKRYPQEDRCIVYQRYTNSEGREQTMNLGGFWPSSSWQFGGPIIERERIAIEPFKDTGRWSAFKFDTGDCEVSAATPLEAAMRCYVAFKFGDEVNE